MADDSKKLMEAVFAADGDSDASDQLARDAIVFEYFCQTYGESTRLPLQQIVSSGIPISIHSIVPSETSPHVVLYTTGMSAYKMQGTG